ncbi:MAG: response regulator [Chloroflexi bacterium]|nr:response regulator [Chloroflexota bacterium]
MTTVLVIEDESVLRREVVDLLTFEGYDVVEAADGREGLREALLHLPDLIISDILMPNLDGHGVLRGLRANPTTRDIPFIFLTAKSNTYDDAGKSQDLGVCAFVSKPFTFNELVEAIQACLKTS